MKSDTQDTIKPFKWVFSQRLSKMSNKKQRSAVHSQSPLQRKWTKAGSCSMQHVRYICTLHNAEKFKTYV